MGSRLRPMSVRLDLAARVAVGAIVGLVIGLAAASCGPQPSPSCPVRFDDAETTAELAAGDACHRAGLRLKAMGCAEFRADWDDFCREMQRQGVPICAVKLSRSKSCEAAREVCR